MQFNLKPHAGLWIAIRLDNPQEQLKATFDNWICEYQ